MRRSHPQPHIELREVNALARRVDDGVRGDRARHDADAVLVRDRDGSETLAVTTASTKFFHALGRQPKGWRLLDVDAEATVWRKEWDASSITLDTSANCNVIVEVF